MASSIRHWCLATGLLEEFQGRGLAHPVQPSELGKLLMGVNGWDPYIEDIGSLWLIHWQLTVDRNRGLVWHLAFSTHLEVEFRKLQLIEFISKQTNQMGIRTTEGMIQREVEVFLRTYVPAQARQGSNSEESLDCPLVDLNLIRFAAEDNVYRFIVGPKPSLPTHIFGYCLLVYLRQIAAHRRTVSVDECVYQPGSPGQAFKLDENSTMTYLEALEELSQGKLRLQETAGLRQIYLHDLELDDTFELLRAYYG